MTSTPSYRHGDQVAPIADVRVLFTVDEAARALGIGRTWMFELIQDGHLETVLIGRLRRIPVEALDALVNRLRETPRTAAAGRQQ